MSHKLPTDLIINADELKANIIKFTLCSRQWKTYNNNHEWTDEKLEKSKIEEIPDKAGVYSLIIKPGIAAHPACAYVIYVGQTNNLRRRFREYLGKERRLDGRPKVFYFLNKYDQNICFCYTLVDVPSLNAVEKGITNAYVPPANEEFEGAMNSIVRSAFM